MFEKTWNRRGVVLYAMFLAVSFSAAATAQGLEDLYQSGRQAFESGRTFEALELLGAVEAADPGFRDIQLLLGQACLVAQLHQPAKRHFERAVAAEPANPHAAFLLGLALHQGARSFEAAEALARARDLAPANPFPRAYRGLALLALGRPGEARLEIEAALDLAPEEAVVRLALAELELAEGDLTGAEIRVRDLLAEAPSAEATILLGRVLVAAGRSAEAVVVLREGPSAAASGGRFDERSEVLYLLGQALLRSSDTAAGREVLARFKARKAFEEDVRVLEAALKRDPDDIEARIRLVRLLLGHRQTDAVVLHLATLERQAPDDPRVRQLARELNRQHRARP